MLGKLAKELNIIVMCSIHQPSTPTFLKFDRVLLLTATRVAYFGETKNVMNYFDKIGYGCQELNMNPAGILALTRSL
eukprot:Pgem_evm1s13632